MGVYDSQIETARRLIAAKGGPCTLVVTTSAVDPAKPWDTRPVDTEQSTPCTGVFLRFKTGEYGTTFANGDVIQQADRKVLVAAKDLAFSPKLKGYLVRNLPSGDENWAVVGIDTLDPNGEKILYTLQVRQ
jgi:hypothetical protein